MEIRLKQLITELKDICPTVYYQPPGSSKMEYPCIRINRSTVNSTYANGKRYNSRQSYDLMLISKSIEDEIASKILTRFENLCRVDREYIADNLYHKTFKLYY